MQYLYLFNKYIICNFRGQRCHTTTIVDIRRQKVKASYVFGLTDFSNNFTSACTLKQALVTEYSAGQRDLVSELDS